MSAVFRSTAEGETGHAHGHLEYLEQVGDPATGLPIGETKANLKSAIAGETHEYSDMYPGMAKAARDRGLRRNRRLVRDPGQGRALARQPLSESTRYAVDGAVDDGGKSGGDARGQSRVRRRAIRSTGSNPSFYDADALEQELERVFDICHGCRRCFSLCQAFPTLFDTIDASSTGELDGVDKRVYWKVVDHCYLCDMCYMTKCPYVPPHPWNVDFPHLMLRAKAVKFRDGATSFRDRLLTSTDRVGSLAGIPVVAQLVNAVNSQQTGPDAARQGSRRASGGAAAEISFQQRAAATARATGAAGSAARRRPRPAGAWCCSPPATAIATNRIWPPIWPPCFAHNGIDVGAGRQGTLLRHAEA